MLNRMSNRSICKSAVLLNFARILVLLGQAATRCLSLRLRGVRAGAKKPTTELESSCKITRSKKKQLDPT